MKKTSLLLAAALAGLAGVALALKVPAGAAAAELRLPDGFRVRAELALTKEAQAQGLMFREALAPDAGMLFVFGDPGVKYFWMKNTYLDLDIVFLDAGLKVLRVFHRVPRSVPGQPEAELARVSSPAVCVLELPAGAARAHRVKPGARLGITFPPKK